MKDSFKLRLDITDAEDRSTLNRYSTNPRFDVEELDTNGNIVTIQVEKSHNRWD